MKRRKTKPTAPKATTVPEVVKVASQIEGLNRRVNVIDSRLVKIDNEGTQLEEERNGIILRREELLRSFDQLAKS